MKQPYEMGPTSDLVFSFNITDWAAKAGVMITGYTVQASASMVVGAHQRNQAVVTVPLKWATGIEEGATGWCLCTFTTSGSPAQVDSRQMTFRCRQR